MGVEVITNAKVYLGGYNLSGDENQVSLAMSTDLVDDTAMGSEFRSRVCGLRGMTLDLNGFFQVDDDDYQVDDVLNSKFGVADEICTVCPTTGAEGEPAFAFKGIAGQYSPGAALGELLKFSAQLQSSNALPIIRGTVLVNGTKSTTANGTAFNLGAVGAGQYLYAVMHVVAPTGTLPTLDMLVQSDAAEGFDTPATKITFSQVTTSAGAQWATRVAGPITDAWWRASWTIGGTLPSYPVIVMAAIQ